MTTKAAWAKAEAEAKGEKVREYSDRPAWGLETRLVSEHDYQREDGTYSYTILKGLNPDGEKTFKTRRTNTIPYGDRLDPEDKVEYFPGLGDQKPVLYRLPKLIEATAKKKKNWRVMEVEGEKDVEAAEELGFLATTNPFGAGKWRNEFSPYFDGADFVSIVDGDDPGREHSSEVCASVRSHVRSITAFEMPGGFKDLSEWKEDQAKRGLSLGTIAANLETVIAANHGNVLAPIKPNSRAKVHEVFGSWLGAEYDKDVLDAVCAVAAAERLAGDPAWLIVISGPGNAKTETVQSVGGLPYAHVISTISSDGALLSASPKRQHAKTATGGLLRKIGARGILCVKDVTSILSSDHKTRATILAALREIHDGKWVRMVGSDGGQTLTWEGRIGVIGACTTAWDHAHSVIATMGDRFVTIRSDSHTGRKSGAKLAVRNTGSEIAMRKEMADAVAGLISGIDVGSPYQMTPEQEDTLCETADVITLARTAVEKDYRGEIIDAHAPEMPTRLVKQLTQIVRGAVAIGMSPEKAMKLALRCARDSMPQLRLEVLVDVARNPGSRTMAVRKRLQKPRTTVDRTLQELHVLGLLTCFETEEERGGKTVQARSYSLTTGFSLKPIGFGGDF